MLGNDALVRRAAGLLLGGRDALLAQIIHGGFDVALRFDERLFAIHQAGTGHFTELADVCRSNFSHKKVGSYSLRVERRDAENPPRPARSN